MFPLQATYHRQPPPPVNGSPVLRVLSVDLTPGSSSALLVSLGYAYQHLLEPAGPPKFLVASLHACHTLRSTPAEPREPRPFNFAVPLCWLPSRPDPSPSALYFLNINEDVSSFRECGLPYGLRDSLCTLQLLRSAHVFLPPHSCNTRYEWLAKPYSTGTFTPLETTSFPWRTSEIFVANASRRIGFPAP